MRTILFISIILMNTKSFAVSNNFFSEGLTLYQQKKLDKAKFKFEQDIVLNPKNEKSYLYLSKIFKELNKNELEEKNLNTVILLNPKNEEANYNLASLKLKKSDFTESKKIVENLLVFCKNYCQKSKELKIEIEKSLKK